MYLSLHINNLYNKKNIQNHFLLSFFLKKNYYIIKVETYMKEYEDMQKMSKEEYLASLRRRSSGFSRGVSKYRGVARFIYLF